MLSTTPRIAVVGGGVLGMSIAAGLAARQAEVVLLTEHGLASGASGRSFSWLNSFGPYPEDYHRLRRSGMALYRRWSADSSSSAHLRFTGGLSWGARGSTSHREAFASMRRNDYPARWVEQAEIPAVAVGVDPTAVAAEGAIFNPDEGWVDLGWLIDQLSWRFLRSGGVLKTFTGKARVVRTGNRARGVQLGDGEPVLADHVVLAVGASTPGMVAELGFELPDASERAALVQTMPITHPLSVTVNSEEVSVRPAPGGTLVMDSAELARNVTLDAAGRYRVSNAALESFLEAARSVLDGHPRLTVARCAAGLKPIPGDGYPVIGALPESDNVSVAFSHSAATLALIVGELLAAEILEGTEAAPLAHFRPSRFGDSGSGLAR